jgi:hypothetical protein
VTSSDKDQGRAVHGDLVKDVFIHLSVTHKVFDQVTWEQGVQFVIETHKQIVFKVFSDWVNSLFKDIETCAE